MCRKHGRILLCTALTGALMGCTIKVDVPPPTVTVQCVVIQLPGGQTTTVCPDGGADGGAE